MAEPVVTPKAPPPTPSGKAPQPFDVRMALAKNLGTPRGEAPPEPAPTKGENVDEPEAPAETEPEAGGEPGDPPGLDPAAEAGEDASEEATEGTAEERLDATLKAFEAGDIEAMAKALQKEGAKVTGPVRRAFRAHQRRIRQIEQRETKADERDRNFEASRSKAVQEIADDSRRAQQLLRHGEQKFGWAAAMERAWDDEDMVGVGKALEKACKGATLATITQRLATGKQGKTPDEQRLAERERKVKDDEAALERKKSSEGDAKQLAQKREAAVSRVGEALKSHPYLVTTNEKGEKVQDAEALNEVFSAYEKSWNGEKFTKTAKACADELQEKLVARAKARGLAPAPAAPAGKPGKPPARKPTPKPALREPPRALAAVRGTPQDLDASRAMRVANAKRITEMQRRGVR